MFNFVICDLTLSRHVVYIVCYIHLINFSFNFNCCFGESVTWARVSLVSGNATMLKDSLKATKHYGSMVEWKDSIVRNSENFKAGIEASLKGEEARKRRIQLGSEWQLFTGNDPIRGKTITHICHVLARNYFWCRRDAKHQNLNGFSTRNRSCRKPMHSCYPKRCQQTIYITKSNLNFKR